MKGLYSRRSLLISRRYGPVPFYPARLRSIATHKRGRSMIVIKAFPRVHISLLDLGDVTPRRYGGAGFSIDGNGLEVSAKSSKQTLKIGLDLLESGRASCLQR